MARHVTPRFNDREADGVNHLVIEIPEAVEVPDGLVIVQGICGSLVNREEGTKGCDGLHSQCFLGGRLGRLVILGLIFVLFVVSKAVSKVHRIVRV
jgi:hypothetical protein